MYLKAFENKYVFHLQYNYLNCHCKPPYLISLGQAHGVTPIQVTFLCFKSETVSAPASPSYLI